MPSVRFDGAAEGWVPYGNGDHGLGRDLLPADVHDHRDFPRCGGPHLKVHLVVAAVTDQEVGLHVIDDGSCRVPPTKWLLPAHPDHVLGRDVPVPRADVVVVNAQDRIDDAVGDIAATLLPDLLACLPRLGLTGLRTAIEADQNYLPQWVAELDALLAASPPAPVDG
jgi:hypothetical protein